MGWDGMRLDLSFSCIVIDGVMKMKCDRGNDVFSISSLSRILLSHLGCRLNELARLCLFGSTRTRRSTNRSESRFPGITKNTVPENRAAIVTPTKQLKQINLSRRVFAYLPSRGEARYRRH